MRESDSRSREVAIQCQNAESLDCQTGCHKTDLGVLENGFSFTEQTIRQSD